MLDRLADYLQVQLLEHWVAWALFGLYLVLTWSAAGLARWLMTGVVTQLTARTNTELDDQLIQASVRPVRFTVLALGLNGAVETLINRIPSLADEAHFGTELMWVERILGAVVILAVTSLVNAIMKAGLDWYFSGLAARTDNGWDRQLRPAVRRVLSLLLYFIAASIILKNKFNQDITALVTTAGVASLAVALAAQETLANMLGSFVILVDRTFKVGDVIELSDGKLGEVIEVGLRSTRIRQFDGNALVIPNKDLAGSQIINWALPTPRAAIRQTIGVAPDTDVDRAKRLLLGVMEAHPDVLEDPAPGAWFSKFNSGSLDLFISCWVESYGIRFRVTDELNGAILKAFREAGIRFAVPQQDIHLIRRDAPSPVDRPANDR